MSLSSVYAVPHPPLLIPEIGLGEESEISDTFQSMERVARDIKSVAPDTIVVVSPHAPHMNDRFVLSARKSLYGDMRRFHAPQVSVHKDVDLDFATRLYAESVRKTIPVVMSDDEDLYIDHGTLVPLYFVEKEYSNYKLIIISLSELSYEDHYTLGRCIAKAASESSENIVLIASGDLSHRLIPDGPYGYVEQGPVFDERITELLRESRLEEIRKIDPKISVPAGECGLRSFIIMSGALSGQSFSTNFMSYEGPFGVGYAVCEFQLTDALSDSDRRSGLAGGYTESDIEDPYVHLARKTLETYIRTDRVISVPEGLPTEMYENRAGVFVSLKIRGNLRGCIGTITATTYSVAEEIIRNAIEAGTRDPRFPPVDESELADLEYSVDVLGPPESISDPSQLDPIQYGVIVSHQGRHGLLLPNLEGVDTIDHQLSIALSKAGIPEDVDYSMERFEVIRHK